MKKNDTSSRNCRISRSMKRLYHIAICQMLFWPFDEYGSPGPRRTQKRPLIKSVRSSRIREFLLTRHHLPALLCLFQFVFWLASIVMKDTNSVPDLF